MGQLPKLHRITLWLAHISVSNHELSYIFSGTAARGWCSDASLRGWDRRYSPGFPAGARWEWGRHTPWAEGTEHLNSSVPSLLTHCSKHQSLQTRRHREIRSSKITGALPGCWKRESRSAPGSPCSLPRSRAPHEGAGTARSHSCFQTAAPLRTECISLGNTSWIGESSLWLSTAFSPRNDSHH